VSSNGVDHTSTAPDAVLAAAVDIAREAAVAVAGAPDAVGAHTGATADAELVVTHSFAAAVAGYTGWQWSVSLARVADDDHVTVDEVVLLPGPDALLAPAWVPWDERVRPGDLSPGDLLPPPPGDPRLVPAYLDSDDPAVDEVAFELGLGRERVLSREGRLDAAERWYTGERGPDTAMARQAPATCGTCGFFLPLAGSLRAGFGACGNEVTDTDGQIVSVEYGCGAHSQTVVEAGPAADVPELVYDDGEEITPGSVRDDSDGAAEAAVPVHDGPAEEAEQPAGEAGPQPDPVIVAAEPAPEGQ
jgi:hypothetical protein